MKNLILHITLPGNFALTDGSIVGQDTTFDVISQLDPYYASVDQVRLSMGPIGRKLSDITVAAQIYQASQESDLLTTPLYGISTNAGSWPGTPGPGSTQFKVFAGSRNQYVTALAARDLLLSVTSLYGLPGQHVLANFSVSRQPAREASEGISARLKELDDSLKLYEVTLRSRGNTAPGGHVVPRFAAKGVFDWTERTPGRTWFNTGIGANNSSADFGSPTGGRGKPVKFFASPFYSPPIVSFRAGVFQGAYPIIVANPYPASP